MWEPQFSVFPDNSLRNRRNAPLGAAVLIFIFCSLKLEKIDGRISKSLRNKLHSLDLMEIVLLLEAVCCLLLVLQQGETLWLWNSVKIIELLADFSILSIAFEFVQWRLDERATISVRILRDRTFLSESLFLALSSSSSYVISLSSCQFFCMVRSLIHTTEIILSFISLSSRSSFFDHTKRSSISDADSTSDDRLDYYKCSDNENWALCRLSKSMYLEYELTLKYRRSRSSWLSNWLVLWKQICLSLWVWTRERFYELSLWCWLNETLIWERTLLT